MGKFIDLTGQIFERLVVIKQAGKDKWGASLWLCRCNCKDKNEIIVRGSSLRSGNTKSCGCFNKEIITHHGHWNDKIYMVWAVMIQRCINLNSRAYNNYGGRGITVCKRWMKFENFYKDMGRDWKPGLQIERRNNNRGYCKENCYWATRKQQARNTRTNRLITFNGRIQCIAAWAEETGISYGTLYSRIYTLNWLPDKALTTPLER